MEDRREKTLEMINPEGMSWLIKVTEKTQKILADFLIQNWSTQVFTLKWPITNEKDLLQCTSFSKYQERIVILKASRKRTERDHIIYQRTTKLALHTSTTVG